MIWLECCHRNEQIFASFDWTSLRLRSDNEIFHHGTHETNPPKRCISSAASQPKNCDFIAKLDAGIE